MKFTVSLKSLFLFFLSSLTIGSTKAYGAAGLPDLSEVKNHSACKLDVESCKAEYPISNAQFPFYISKGQGKIDKVIIVIHGTDRNATDYLRDFITSNDSETTLANTLVIAPHFLQVDDQHSAQELSWVHAWENSWKFGAKSESPAAVNSYAVIDQLVKSADISLHPKKIIVMGHSAGGQFVQRYAYGSQVRKGIQSSLTYVVSNPSSYLYMHDERWLDNKWIQPLVQSCPDYNLYIYGPKGRNDYFAGLSDSKMESNYLQNNVFYLMGTNDVLTEDLDQSCGANLQGVNRITRAKNFFQYLNSYYPGQTHQFLMVEGVGHDHVKMFSSEEFLKILNK